MALTSSGAAFRVGGLGLLDKFLMRLLWALCGLLALVIAALIYIIRLTA